MNISNLFKKIRPSGLRSQLILGIAFILIMTVSFFVLDMVNRQRAFYVKLNHDRGIVFSESIAKISTAHVVAHELYGLQILLKSYRKLPGFEYAMILSPEGVVIAHSNEKFIGLVPSDSISKKLQPKLSSQILIENDKIFDIASPIINKGKLIGWVRVGISQTYLEPNITAIKERGLLYFIISLIAGVLLAAVIADKLSKGLLKLTTAAKMIKSGNRDLRVVPTNSTEVTQLGIAINQMLDDISANEKLLSKVLENMPVGVFILDPKGKILSLNPAAQHIWEGVKYVNMGEYNVYKGWFPDTGKEIESHEWGAAVALNEDREVLNQEVEIEGFGGGRKTILNSCIPLHDANEKITGAISINIDITELKEAEASIRVAEERRKLVINAALDAIISIDAESRIISWNSQAEKIFGWLEKEAIGKLLNETIIPEKHRNSHAAGMVRYLTTGEEKVLNRLIEITAINSNGEEFPVELSIVPVKQNDKVSFTAFIRDITERKNAENELRKKNHAIGERVKELRCLYRISELSNGPNKTMKHILQDCVEIISQSYQYPDITCVRIKYKGKVFESPDFIETIWKQEQNILINDTIVGKVEVYYKVEMPEEAEGPFLAEERLLINSIADILGNSAKRKKAEKRIRESEEKKRALIENISDTIILLNKKFKLTYQSPSYIRTSGFTVEEMKGKTVLEHIHPDDLLIAIDNLKQAEANPGASISSLMRILHKAGHYIWIEGTITNLLHNESVKAYIVNYRDVSNQKKMELEREKNIAELLQRNRDLEQFSYIVSHNLRGPVSTIMGLSDILQGMQLSSEEKQTFIMGMGDSAQKLDIVIRDLNATLQVKRDLSEKRELVSFSKLTDEVKASLSSLIENEKAQFIYDFKSVSEMITIKSYMYSIFYNLISNSIKYRQPNVDLVISITSEITENKTILRFKDNGLGINLQKKGDQVFGLYKRFHLHIEGKGMGLFMVKTQVEAIGGKISIQSQENVGTEFKIEFEN